MMWWLRFLIVLVGLLASVPAGADPFNDGLAAYNQGNYATALRLFRPLAKQGDARAQLNLGFMYGNGRGVPQGYFQAHKWYNLAASRYPASEKEQRERVVKNRDIVATKMTPQQIAEAQRLVREWEPGKAR